MSFEEKTPTLYFAPDDITSNASDRVKCTISGNTCSQRDGAFVCSCVGCTVWRSRESSAVPAQRVLGFNERREHRASETQ